MPLDQSVVGRQLPTSRMTVEAGRLRFFAAAIGETAPIYTDVEAARAAGYPNLPVPPTFLFSIELDGPAAFTWLAELGIDLRRVLHGEQSFIYHETAVAGDVLTATPTVGKVYSKKGGALDFLEKDTTVTRADGTLVAELKSVIVVRNPEVTA